MSFATDRDEAFDPDQGSSWAPLVRDIGIALATASLCLVLASNLTDLALGKGQLDQLATRQEATLKTTGKAESQLDSLATGLQQLAAGGNANAQKIVTVLQANGVHIKS